MFTENYHKLQQVYLNLENPSRTAKTTSYYLTSDTSIRITNINGNDIVLYGPYNSSAANTYGFALPNTLLKPFTNCFLYATLNTEAAYSDYMPIEATGLTRISSSMSREIVGTGANKSLKIDIGAVYRNDTAAAFSVPHLMILQDIFEDTLSRFVIFSHHLDTPIVINAGERKKIQVSLTFPMYY